MTFIVYAFMTSAFIGVLLFWLQYEFKRPASFTKYWRWLAAGLVLQFIAGVIFEVHRNLPTNILEHAVGGGVMSALLFEYLYRTYGLRFNWRVKLVVLYAFVSALGIMNELAEYTGEFLGLGTFSLDRHDTWRDMAANTSGAVVTFLFVQVLRRFDKK